MEYKAEITKLIEELGSSRIYSSAYDTAWAAQLKKLGEPMGERALDWLRENQLPDGSWGNDLVAYGHDRVICTLASMVALARCGKDSDKKYIERARVGLDVAMNRLVTDIAGATVGFEMLVPDLLETAYELGAIKRKDDFKHPIAYPLVHYYHDRQDKTTQKRQSDIVYERLRVGKDRKISSLPEGLINRWVTLAFSAEMAGEKETHLIDAKNLQESNGSVACSPSATAYYALNINPGDESALAYLRNIANREWSNDGGMPEIAPFDTFEIGWSLWNLALPESLDGEVLTLAQPKLDFLETAWAPGRGSGFSAIYTPKDGDDTCLLHETLTRYDREVDIEAVLSYEKEDHFRCYDLESDASVGVNVHVLSTLRQAGFPVEHSSVQKVINYIKRKQLLNTFWADKWHISPYYVTAHTIIAASGYENDLVYNAVEWMIDTQKKDGSWGYYIPTAEETAHTLQALLIWNRFGGKVPRDVLKKGLDWLETHMEPPYTSLWISKTLYTPELLVRSSILSALMLGKDI